MSRLPCDCLTDDVWQLIFRYLTAKELLLCASLVNRRFFQLILGDPAASTHFWREMWLTHLTARGGSHGSGGLGTLIQSVGPAAGSRGEGGAQGIGRLNEVIFVMDDYLVSTLSSPLLFSVAPVHLSYIAAATESSSGDSSATCSCGLGTSASRSVTFFSPSAIAARATVHREPSSPASPLLSSHWSRLHHKIKEEEQQQGACGQPFPITARTDTFLRLLSECLIEEGEPTEGNGSGGASVRKAREEKELALLYAKALAFLLPRSRPRNVLEGNCVDIVHINTFSATTNDRRVGTDEESFRKAIELKKCLQQSWESMYSGQLINSAPPLLSDTPSPGTHLNQTAGTVVTSGGGKLGKNFKTGNVLFDLNVLSTRANKRTDVYQAIVTGVRASVPHGLGFFFPICASSEALAEWRRIRREEADVTRGCGARTHGAESVESEEVVLAQGDRAPSPRPHRSLRAIAEEEERVVMADGGWAAPRRYIMAPFFEEDDSSSSSSSGSSTSDTSSSSRTERGQRGGGRIKPRKENQSQGRPPRLSSAQKAELRAEKAARRAERFRADEEALFNHGAVHGSICLNARLDCLPKDNAPLGPSVLPGGSSSAMGNLYENSSQTGFGGRPQQQQQQAGMGSGSSSTSLAIESDSGVADSSSISLHTDDYSDAGVNSSPSQDGGAVDHRRPGARIGETVFNGAQSRVNENTISSEATRRVSLSLPELNDTALNGIFAPGALAIRTPTNHQIPFAPALTAPVPFLFPLKHMATYLYLLQHITFSDVHHHIWEPNEAKCAVCAHIVSPTGDCVETRFFTSHLGGSYPRVYMKMTFSPGDLPGTLFLKKMEQPTEVLPPSSSSSNDSSDSGNRGAGNDGRGNANGGGEQATGAAGDRHQAPLSHAFPPPNPTAFPPPYAIPLSRLTATASESVDRMKARKPRAAVEDEARQRKLAHARRQQRYRHQHLLDFDAMVDVFCGGFGRVEVDIPPSISRKGLEVLRAVLGLGEDYPMSLLWNVVAYATGLGPKVWEGHLATFLYQYKMTYTDAVERAFGLRECYGPLNDLRPREFADLPGQTPAVVTTPTPIPTPAAPADAAVSATPVGWPTAGVLPLVTPVTVVTREHVADSDSDSDSSEVTFTTTVHSTAHSVTTTTTRRNSDNDGNGRQPYGGPEDTDEYSSSNYLDDHERDGDFSDASQMDSEHEQGPVNPLAVFPPPPLPLQESSSDVQAMAVGGSAVYQGANLREGLQRANETQNPPPQRRRRLQRTRDSDSDSSSEPALGVGGGDSETDAAGDADDGIYSDISVSEAWQEAYY